MKGIKMNWALILLLILTGKWSLHKHDFMWLSKTASYIFYDTGWSHIASYSINPLCIVVMMMKKFIISISVATHMVLDLVLKEELNMVLP